MLDKIFNMNTYNLIEDNNNYYFFRALNNGDLEDYKNKIILDNKNKITKIRTDRERYIEIPKYNENSKLSLEEIIDHIKPNHRYDTNCISLSTNANVAALYGREYYKDKYIMIKVSKTELNKQVIDAGLYILKKINNSLGVEYNINNNNNYINKDAIYFNILNKNQKKEIKIIINKIKSIDKNIIKNIDNKTLIEAINNAFLSLEFIHYKSINKNKIIELSPLQIDIFSIIQQLPSKEKRKTFTNILLNNLDNIHTQNKILTNNITTNNKLYYLAKSKLRVLYSIDELNRITNNKYKKYLSQIKQKIYGVEPNIFSKSNTNKYKANNYVYLNLNKEEIHLLEYINKLNKKELENIIIKNKK